MHRGFIWGAGLLLLSSMGARALDVKIGQAQVQMQRAVTSELEKYADTNKVARGWVQYCQTETERKRSMVPRENDPPFTTNYNNVAPELVGAFIELDRNYRLHDGLLCLANAKQLMEGK